MSSDDDQQDDYDIGQGDEKNKKRRIQRACDTCRRKKIRCDGAQMVDNRCTNCITWNMDCTYVEAAKKRGPPKGYVESLENRLEKMEKLLRSLCPDADFTKELGTFIDRETWYHERSANKQSGGTGQVSYPKREVPPVGGMRATATTRPGVSPEDEIISDDDTLHVTLAEGLRELSVNVNDRRFHGKSSGIMLVQAAMDFKREYSGGEDDFGSSITDSRREEFWSPPDWEATTFDDTQTHVDIPPDDLVRGLFDIFFTYMNPFMPIHHRPTLERNYQEGLHHTNKTFAATLLLTCAVAARWSDDPRVFLEDRTKHSAGWAFFEQAQTLRRNTLAPPNLYDVQVYVLSAIFLTGSSAPQAAWTMIGIGIRLAQDVGAHRRKVYNAATTVEDELWKRAFWCLVGLDRGASSALGRPCAVQDEDFDLDHPLEVDDEYWESPDPAQCFKQPPDKPTKVAFFNCSLKLAQILAFALRTIYSINKSKILLGFVGPQWEQHIVAELDSALNKWIDSVPDHLRWDPNREDPLFFAQSATLYATYYHLQILIHRPFIPTPRKPSPLSFPSLAICTNAARSCSHVLDIARRRQVKPTFLNMSSAFTSGIVLLLNIWGAKKSGMQSDPVKQMQDVHKCMQHLKDVEVRFRAAGRLWDILYELATVGELPLPQPSPPFDTRKRPREPDTPVSTSRSSTVAPSSEGGTSHRLVARSKANPSSRAGSTPASTSTAHTAPSQTPTPPLPGAGNMFAINIPHPLTSNQLGTMQQHPEHGYPQVQDPMIQPWYDPAISNAQFNPAQQQGYPAPPGQGAMFGLYQPQAVPSHNIPYGGETYPQTALPIPGVQRSFGSSEHLPQQGNEDFLNVTNMWSNAPPNFEYEDWDNWVTRGVVDPNTGMLGAVPHDPNLQPHQQQQHPPPR